KQHHDRVVFTGGRVEMREAYGSFRARRRQIRTAHFLGHVLQSIQGGRRDGLRLKTVVVIMVFSYGSNHLSHWCFSFLLVPLSRDSAQPVKLRQDFSVASRARPGNAADDRAWHRLSGWWN